MSNAKRPSVQRKDTRKTRENRQAELDQGVRITLDGEVYEVRLGDITPLLARRFRREYEAPFSELIEELSDKADIDSIAGVIWMARMLRGEDVSFADIEVGYADVDGLDVEVAEPEQVGDNPEA